VSYGQQRELRVFVADPEWTELTSGEQPAERFSASDLQRAQRMRRRIEGDAVLDITVVLDDDFRSAQIQAATLNAAESDSLSYAGTLDGLAGLVADLFVAGVADGVTLIPAAPQQDARSLGEATLARVAARLQAAA
jgi:hypothetical protein